MVNLNHVSDEDVVEIFHVVTGLMNGLSGGFNNERLWEEALEIEKACLAALRKGEDNKELVERLEKEGHTRWV